MQVAVPKKNEDAPNSTLIELTTSVGGSCATAHRQQFSPCTTRWRPLQISSNGKPMASIHGGSKPRSADVPMGFEADQVHKREGNQKQAVTSRGM